MRIYIPLWRPSRWYKLYAEMRVTQHIHRISRSGPVIVTQFSGLAPLSIHREDCSQTTWRVKVVTRRVVDKRKHAGRRRRRRLQWRRFGGGEGGFYCIISGEERPRQKRIGAICIYLRFGN